MKARLLIERYALGILIAGGLAASACGAPFQLVSQRGAVPSPAGGSGDSWGPIISPDGRFVLFASTANNLVSLTNGQALPVNASSVLNVFLRDRASNTTTLVSVNLTATGGGNGDSIPTAISTNGRFACFESSASNLVPADTNAALDVFVRDLVNSTTILVSASTNGAVANGASRSSVMTPDGRYVAFVSAASSLVPGDTNGIPDVFVRDLQSNATTWISAGARSTNSLPLSSSESPEITPDGCYVAFYSSATNLVPGVTHGGEIYVSDLVWGTIVCASTNVHSLLGTNAFSYNHAISADGLYVAYEASSNAPPTTGSRSGYILRFNMANGAADLVNTNAFVPPSPAEEINNLDMSPDGRFIAFVGNTNGTSGTTSGIFRWDAQSGTSLLVSADVSGNVPTNSICDSPRVDPTGRFVSFLSSATGLVTNSLIGDYHLYLRDTIANLTTLLDMDTNGLGSSVSPATVARFSGDAGLAAFESLDASLVANDRNHAYDLFVRNLSAGSNELISVRLPAFGSASPNGPSMVSAHGVFPDGWRVLFSSEADNLIESDTNSFRDVFIRDRIAGTNILVSISTNGLPADGFSFGPVLSADGRFVAFASSADDLVTNDTNRSSDVFVRDLAGGTTALVSVKSSGTGTGNKGSSAPLIGVGGRFIAFRSFATDLAPVTFSSGRENLFLRDRQSDMTYALTTSGVQSFDMTPDGRYVAFSDTSSPGTINIWDSQAATKIYSNSITNGITSAVGISPDGNRLIYGNRSGVTVLDRIAQTSQQLATSGLSPQPGLQFTLDSRYVVYSRTNSGTNQVYIYDFQTGGSLPVSHNPSAFLGNGDSDSPTISADGRFVAYRSFATDLVPLSATNGFPNLYLFDRLANSNALLTASIYRAGPADNRSRLPFFSEDGRTLVFESVASDLSTGDFNSSADVFALSFLYGTISTGLAGPTLSWPAWPGATYHVQFKDALSDLDWQEVSGIITVTGDRAQLLDPVASSSQRFYRIIAN